MQKQQKLDRADLVALAINVRTQHEILWALQHTFSIAEDSKSEMEAIQEAMVPLKVVIANLEQKINDIDYPTYADGETVVLAEMPGAMGYDHLEPDTHVGELCKVNYVNGCCLCVTTAGGVEFTANVSRFKKA